MSSKKELPPSSERGPPRRDEPTISDEVFERAHVSAKKNNPVLVNLMRELREKDLTRSNKLSDRVKRRLLHKT